MQTTEQWSKYWIVIANSQVVCQETKTISCKGLKRLCVAKLGLAGWFWQSILSTISQSSDSLTYLAKWINKSLSHTALVGPMHHSCLASHLSSESTKLLGMGNVKPPPNFFFLSFICSLHHSHSLADLQFVKSLLHKDLQKSPAKSSQIMWTKWLMSNNDVSSGEAAEKVDADQTYMNFCL